jgi:rare lipoprotein A
MNSQRRAARFPSRNMLRAAAFLGALCGGIDAVADPAPITYAALPGGEETSYGYGAARSDRGGVIDLTRPSTPSAAPVQQARAQAQPVQQRAPAPAGQRPAWLEQERVGPPYEANGRWYVPTPYEQTGEASWYGPGFHGAAAANGETYDQEAMTAAHPTLPLQSLVQVTNLQNGREVIVRITDRGPFVGERLIDLSRRAADALGFQTNGTTRVHVRYLGPAPRRYGAGPSPSRNTQPAAPIVSQPAAEPTPAYEPAPIAAPEPTHVALNGAYVVQVGAYSDLMNAHRVQAAVESAGQVQVEPRQTASGGEIFRVRVGGYASRAEAEAARAQVASLGYPEAVVASR